MNPINEQLTNPKSIAILGGSEDRSKPGGAVLHNLIKNGYNGYIYCVNTKGKNIQGQITYNDIGDMPHVDCAILAIPAAACPDAVKTLCSKKGCRAVIILSAGFAESGPEGSLLQKQIVDTANKYGAVVIGPNCTGIMTERYSGIFTTPGSINRKSGVRTVDLISGSGATIVYLWEQSIVHGISLANVFSIGNSAQVGAEDILEYLDGTYIKGKSSDVIMLYLESIPDPEKFCRHAASLTGKGVHITAIKSGKGSDGKRAASCHTGAMATPDQAIESLFRKAGIIRASGREELINIAAVLTYGKPEGNRLAIVTHAGGPGVMLADVLNSYNINIPKFTGKDAELLKSRLFNGSSISNPIDFLATGTLDQLMAIIDFCEMRGDVDAIAVIFGSHGLSDVAPAYRAILDRIKISGKIIYPIFPSTVNAAGAIKDFHKKGGVTFSEETDFAKAFAKVALCPGCFENDPAPAIDIKSIRSIIESSASGFLSPGASRMLLDACGIERTKEIIAYDRKELVNAAIEIGYPVAIKVLGHVHKTDIGGVSLNIADENTLITEFLRMMHLKDCRGVLVQPMISGTEVYIGAKKLPGFGPLVFCGLGGVYTDAIKDVAFGLSPISRKEAQYMISSLKCSLLLKGSRGKEGVNGTVFAEYLRRISALCRAAPEIEEITLDPLIGNNKKIIAIDVRIRIS